MGSTPVPSPEGHASHAHGRDHAHGHTHEGGHTHGHGTGGHHHAPASFGRAFAIGITLNIAFIGVEVVGGVAGHSVALLADAGHNVSDVLGLFAAWLATHLAARAATARYTYGLGSSSILAALFNAVLLLVVVGALSLEAIQRMWAPEPVEGGLVMAIAAAGVLVNGGTALLFMAGRKTDLNVRGAFLHMAADALVSVGVIVAGGVITLTGWLWLDPVTSLVVNAIIVAGTWGLLRDSLAMSLNAVPPGIEIAAVRRDLLDRAGVAALHDLHVWSTSTTETALSAHLAMPGGHPGDAFLFATAAELQARFGIGHVTLQVETDQMTSPPLCPLAEGHGGTLAA